MEYYGRQNYEEFSTGYGNYGVGWLANIVWTFPQRKSREF
jgi:hypothetical protein